MPLKLNLGNIKDDSTRDAIGQIQKGLNDNDVSSSKLKLIAISHPGAVTGEFLYHSLGFIPTDIWITKQVGGTITWDWPSATTDKIKYTTSAAIEVRLLIGRI